jgi:uncharacterized repeat protein (TIGR03843 family)
VWQSARSGRPHLPAPQRAVHPLTKTVPPLTDAIPSPTDDLAALRDGEIEVLGWLTGSSNNAMVVRVWSPGTQPAASGVAPEDAPERRPSEGHPPIRKSDLLGVWKPTRGERPLFDFPIGTLARREVAGYLVSEAMGWGIVPPTVLRVGPHGEGMLQRWIDVDPEVNVIAMFEADDSRLRRIAVFDAVTNNTDRKLGHVLPVSGGHLFAVDHGVTFSVVPKLRTVLWAWEGQPFELDEVAGLERVRDALGGDLGAALRELLSAREIEATRSRVETLLAAGVFPSPNPDWPAVPWPPY